MKNKRKIGITLMALVFAVNFLLNNQKFINFSFDLDEIFAIKYAQSISNINFFKYVDNDLGNPPLFFFILKPFTTVSQSEICLRSLPMIFYLVSLFFIYKTLGILKVPDNLKILSMIMAIGIGPYFYLSLYVRAYSLLLLMIVATIYLTFRLIEKFTHKDLAQLVLIIFLGFYTHYIYWVFFALWVFSYFLIGLKNRIPLKKQVEVWGGYVGGLALVFPLICHLLSRELINQETKYDWWQLEKSPISLLDWTEIFFKIDLSQFVIAQYLVYLLWTMFLLVSLYALKKRHFLSEQMLLVFNNIFLLVFFNTSLANRFSMSKYIAAFILLVSLSIPIILNSFNSFRRFYTQKYLFMLCFVCIALWSVLPMPDKHRVEGGDDWKKVATIIENKFSSHALVVDCLQADGINFYGKRTQKLYGSRAHFSQNFCNLPDIKDHKEQWDNIVVVGDIQESAKLGISDTHEEIKVIGDYQPIVLTIYEKR